METILIIAVLFLVAILLFGTAKPRVTVYNVKFDPDTGMYECFFLWHNKEREGCFELPEGEDEKSLNKDDKFYVAGVDCSDGCCFLVREKIIK